MTTNPEEAREAVEKKIILNLQCPDGKVKLENHLSRELNTKLQVEEIETGSIIIVIKLHDLDCLEKLRYLSRTEYLSNSIDDLLITDQFLEECQQITSDITLHVTLLEESYQTLLSLARGK